MTLKTEEAIKIAEQIQEDILHNKELSALTMVRQYYSLVKLLNKQDEVEWALNELYGYNNDVKTFPNYRKIVKGKNEFTFILEDCGKVENMMMSGHTYTYKGVKLPSSGVKLKKNSVVDILTNFNVGYTNFYHILHFITNEIYRKTQQILIEIKFGKFEFDIFEETRKVVDSELSKRCPKAFEKLAEAYEDLMKSESSLDLQQTAHACRVVLKDFADAVFPVSDKKTFIDLDGKSHPIKDDDYINRIIACIQENTDSKTDREFIKNSLIYLGNFLKSINDLASIGTHHEISKEDANRCLIYTYLVLGDIIKLLGKQYAPIGI